MLKPLPETPGRSWQEGVLTSVRPGAVWLPGVRSTAGTSIN
jgi:hypothetical protein